MFAGPRKVFYVDVLTATPPEPDASLQLYCGDCRTALSGVCAVCRRSMVKGEPVGCPLGPTEHPRCSVCFEPGGTPGAPCGRWVQSWNPWGGHTSGTCGGTIYAPQMYVAHGHPSCVRRR